jgi:hypothetical protein
MAGRCKNPNISVETKKFGYLTMFMQKRKKRKEKRGKRGGKRKEFRIF